MNIEDFDYSLPESLIAAAPLAKRDAARMLRIDRAAETIRDSSFSEFPQCLIAGDVLVINNTKVFPARLTGKLDTGAAIELLLEEETGPNTWSALAKPAKRLKAGKRIFFDGLVCEVAERRDGGTVIVNFPDETDVWQKLQTVGKTPLPHYLKRADEDDVDDRERYQTVYAEKRGAIAAPTAGLHFTESVLQEIRDRGVSIVQITLHVGYGTFEPVRVNDLSEHRVLPERIEVSEASAEILNTARREERRVVAVGTTTTRALESAIDDNGSFAPFAGRTSLTITPGCRFRAVDALLTNFHLPKSSLLILVSTFGGHELIMESYRHAVAERYRFYSYGDCMFIE